MNLQAASMLAAVLDEPLLAEPVHEKADSRSGGTDHLRQRLLTNLWDNRLGIAVLARIPGGSSDSPRVCFLCWRWREDYRNRRPAFLLSRDASGAKLDATHDRRLVRELRASS